MPILREMIDRKETAEITRIPHSLTKKQVPSFQTLISLVLYQSLRSPQFNEFFVFSEERIIIWKDKKKREELFILMSYMPCTLSGSKGQP